jgi:hypothetical protein
LRSRRFGEEVYQFTDELRFVSTHIGSLLAGQTLLQIYNKH